MKLVTAAQMREIDRHCIEDLQIPGMVLMENAGRGVARCAERVLRALGGRRVHIVAGRGNNGGDGFVAARHLHNAGCDVAVTLLAAAGDLQGDAAANHGIWAAMPTGTEEMPELASPQPLRERLIGADVVIDGILGTGVTGEVRGPARAAIEALRDVPRERVVAIDIPSGVDSDTGQVLGAAVRAGYTITFGLPKIGLYQHPGAAHAGEVIVQDIGIPRAELTSDRLPLRLTTAADVSRWLPGRPADAHKGNCGRVFIVAGSVGMTGAAAMAGMAALRAGAGLVTVGVPASLNDVLEAKLTEVMTRPLPECAERALSLAAEETILEMAEGSEACVVGPGLSLADETQELVRRLVPQIHRPLALDADALTALSENAEVLAGREAPTVVTPHPGEMSRLVDRSIEAIQADRVSAALEAARSLGSVVLLKGAGSVGAAPDGTAYVNATGNAGMASGGTGDVLSGILGGLLGQGMLPLEAAAAAAHVHGLAGDLAAPDSERALVAGDMLEALPRAFAAAEAAQQAGG
ncbi:MAG: NAD(P)H-hydrate dehydratase [Armatimonadota bacterium]